MTVCLYFRPTTEATSRKEKDEEELQLHTKATTRTNLNSETRREIVAEGTKESAVKSTPQLPSSEPEYVHMVIEESDQFPETREISVQEFKVKREENNPAPNITNSSAHENDTRLLTQASSLEVPILLSTRPPTTESVEVRPSQVTTIPKDGQSKIQLKSEVIYEKETTLEAVNEFSSVTRPNDSSEGTFPAKDLVSVEGREEIDSEETSESEPVPSTTTIASLLETTTVLVTTTNASKNGHLPQKTPTFLSTVTEVNTLRTDQSPSSSSSSSPIVVLVSQLPVHSLSVDGFAVPERDDHSMSSVSTPTLEVTAHLADVKVPNGTVPNRVLIASEESFDLYALTGTATAKPIASPTTEATVKEEEKAEKVWSTETAPPGDNEFNNGGIGNSGQTLGDEEFLLYSSLVDGTGAGADYGKRISKKLNLDNLKLNSIPANDLTKPGKGDDKLNASIEQYNDISGPDLKGLPTTGQV